MRCLNCKYDLRKLSEHRCPECGRPFNPNDPKTFDTRKRSDFRYALTIILLAGGIFVVAVVAFFALGFYCAWRVMDA
jgi:predicted amidophosphoribosyltransferase